MNDKVYRYDAAVAEDGSIGEHDFFSLSAEKEEGESQLVTLRVDWHPMSRKSKEGFQEYVDKSSWTSFELSISLPLHEQIKLVRYLTNNLTKQPKHLLEHALKKAEEDENLRK